jgi:hypothetical protein
MRIFLLYICRCRCSVFLGNWGRGSIISVLRKGSPRYPVVVRTTAYPTSVLLLAQIFNLYFGAPFCVSHVMFSLVGCIASNL